MEDVEAVVVKIRVPLDVSGSASMDDDYEDEIIEETVLEVVST